MDLELRFFATFREAVGEKTVVREYPEGTPVGEVLADLQAAYPDLDGQLLDDEGDLQPQISVMKDGRNVIHLEGRETELSAGDVLSVFPPVAGG